MNENHRPKLSMETASIKRFCVFIAPTCYINPLQKDLGGFSDLFD